MIDTKMSMSSGSVHVSLTTLSPLNKAIKGSMMHIAQWKAIMFLYSPFSTLDHMLNPLAPEFKIPAEPINAGDKMAVPSQEPISLRITLYSPFLQPNQLH